MPLNLQSYKRFAPQKVGKPQRGTSAVPTVRSPVQPLMPRRVPGWKPPAGFTVPKATGFQSAGAAAASPSGPAAPGPVNNPQPWDTQFENEINTNTGNYKGTYAAIKNAALRGGNDYGYKVGFNPLDPDGGGGDPLALSDEDVNEIGQFNNPFSKLALIRKAYGEQKNRTVNSMAAQGQLYSGALLNQQQYDLDANTRDEYGNRLGFEDLVRGLVTQRGGAFGDLLTANTSAGGTRLDRALENPPPDPGPKPKPGILPDFAPDAKGRPSISSGTVKKPTLGQMIQSFSKPTRAGTLRAPKPKKKKGR